MSHSKVIAKNTIFLYLRTILIMLISLYTSRVLLDKLGVDNFGIYNLIGGVVAAFASLRTIFAQSVQRFLNYEKGKGNKEKVRFIFSISVYLHIALGVLFGLLVLIFGYFYIPNNLVLPSGSLHSALFVFYCSVITAVISIITIPYDSVIIANERFNFYAYTSIFDVLSRLGILYILWIGNDVLITYAILILIVTFFFRIINIIYSFRFEECRLIKKWDKEIFIDLAGFSWWNFLGNTAYSLTNEGVNFVINTYAGVGANAARGLAYQVKAAVTQLSGNIGVAARPYVTEAVAYKENRTIFSYVTIVSRAMFLMVALTVLPIITYTEHILKLWLSDVPEYTVIFVQLIAIHMVIRAPQTGIDLLFSSYNKMKNYQIVQSVLLFLSLPSSYMLLRIGLPIYWVFIAMCIVEGVTLAGILMCATKELGFSIVCYSKDFLKDALILSMVLAIDGYVFHRFVIPSCIIMLLIDCIILLTIGISLSYAIFISKNEKELIKSFIIKKNNSSL